MTFQKSNWYPDTYTTADSTDRKWNKGYIIYFDDGISDTARSLIKMMDSLFIRRDLEGGVGIFWVIR